MADEFAGCLLRLLFQVLVQMAVVWTGEVVLWIFTLGRWRPEFVTSPIEAELFLRPSLWVGVVTWFAIGGAIWALW
jgi:hypothetical protein